VGFSLELKELDPSISQLYTKKSFQGDKLKI